MRLMNNKWNKVKIRRVDRCCCSYFYTKQIQFDINQSRSMTAFWYTKMDFKLKNDNLSTSKDIVLNYHVDLRIFRPLYTFRTLARILDYTIGHLCLFMKNVFYDSEKAKPTIDKFHLSFVVTPVFRVSDVLWFLKYKLSSL